MGTTAGVPRLLPLAVAAAIALIPASASAATTLATPDGTLRPQPYQGWVDGSLMPTPDGTVTLSLDGCGGGLSCAPEGALLQMKLKGGLDLLPISALPANNCTLVTVPSESAALTVMSKFPGL